jgi:hypothetical protein
VGVNGNVNLEVHLKICMFLWPAGHALMDTTLKIYVDNQLIETLALDPPLTGRGLLNPCQDLGTLSLSSPIPVTLGQVITAYASQASGTYGNNSLTEKGLWETKLEECPGEDESTDKEWVNEKKAQSTFALDPQEGSVSGIWEVSGDVKPRLITSEACPVIDNIDKILGAGSGKYDGTCYSIFEDVEDWDLANEDFTIEFWYKKSGDSTPSNIAPFAANGTCIIARQGYGFSKESLSWGVELSYVEEDLGTAFFSWRQQGRINKTIKNLNLQGSPSVLQNSFLPNWSSLGVLSSPEMRFYFCVDNGTATPPAAWANITDPGVDGKKMATFTLTLGSPLNDVWEHYAIVRKENEFKTYKNGKLIDSMGEGIYVTRYGEGASYAWNGFNIKAPANNPVLAIGADTRFINNNWYLKGNLDEIRISKGVARYLENFQIETVKIDESAVESTITTSDKIAAITYCPPSKALYAFTFDSGISYSIDPMTNAITYAYQFSDSETERVKESYFCPINNSILISSYDGVYRIYSFLPKTGSIDRAFSVYDEGKFAYAPTMNKMYYVGRNYAYEIGD